MTTSPSSQAAMQASDGTPTPSDRDSAGQGAGAEVHTAPASLGEALEALEDMVVQFACRRQYQGGLCLTAGGLSALEGAFAALGWTDPYPAKEMECEVPDCHEEATCGTPTPDGYRRLCGNHYVDFRRAAIPQKDKP